MNGIYEKIVLLVVGLLFTGILVPIVKFVLDKMQFATKTKLEDSIRRHSQVLDARAKTIVELAQSLWDYHILHGRLAYYGTNEMHTEIKDAWLQYESKGWKLIVSTRALIGGMRWLLSEEEHKKLIASYYTWKNELEEKCPDEVEDENNAAKWDDYRKWLDEESSPKIDSLIGALADQFSLPDEVK